MHFFKPGVYARDLIDVFEIDGETVAAIDYSADLFDLGAFDADQDLFEAAGFGGIKIVYPLEPRHSWKDELAVFHGASYFRVLGRGQQYGLSARGVAIDTGLPRAEEFPVFRAFWLRQPDPDADSITVLALLDGPSVTGAYRFDIAPGDETTVDVQARIFPRRPIEKLGLAPLTSMFLNGESEALIDPARFAKHIHDSDGMLLHLGKTGEWVWRPLEKRAGYVITQHFDENPRGFGLFQRLQDADAFPSPEKRYHLRPGYWIEPQGDWGSGHLQLVEIASDDEDFDNLALFWVPDAPPGPGDRRDFSYRLTSTMKPPSSRPGFGVVKRSSVIPLDSDSASPYLAVTIVFSGLPEGGDGADSQPISPLYFPDVMSFHGEPEDVDLKWSGPGEATLTFSLSSTDPARADIRAGLVRNGEAATEIWSYLWTV